MDIDLLAKMVKNLILDNERVVLPGLGCFVAELVPSTFSDKGYTINPPYRRLYFRSKPDEGNELIAFYAKSNNIPEALADNVIRDFLSEMKEVLFMKKTVVFPGLGRLRATKENDIFFVADEDLDIYPAGFGLEPVSLKTHQETPEQVAKAVGSLKSILDEPAPEEPVEKPVEKAIEEPVEKPIEQPVERAVEVPAAPQPAPAPVETALPQQTSYEKVETPSEEAEAPKPMPRPAPRPGMRPAPRPGMRPAPRPGMRPAPRPRPMPVPASTEKETVEMKAPEVEKKAKSPKMKTALIVLACIVGVAVVFFVAFQILAMAFPEWMDSLLYSQEELQILNQMYE